MAGGYPCFLVSLAMIGLIVIVVGDLAGIFGCLVGLKDEVWSGGQRGHIT